MSTRPQERRKAAIVGTTAIWSVTTYSATLLLVALLVPFLVPFMTPLETPGTPISWRGALFFFLIVVVVFFNVVRKRIWRPIHALARILNDPRVMRQHCMASVRCALPYALVFMLPVASLTFDFQVWIIALQFGVLIFIDNWMGTHRKPRIKALVDRALSVD